MNWKIILVSGTAVMLLASPAHSKNILDAVLAHDARLEAHIAAAPEQIDSCRIIGARGSYILVRNLAATVDQTCLTVDADDVTIDLQGFAITGPGSGSGIAIAIAGPGRSNVEVRNGTLRGFRAGIEVTGVGVGSSSLRAIQLRALSNVVGGIDFRKSFGALVKDCTAEGNGFAGIVVESGSTVTGNTVAKNGTGIAALGSGVSPGFATVTGNTAFDNVFDGIVAGYSTVTGNAAHNNGLNGIRVSSGTLVKGNTASQNVLSNIQAEFADNAIEENLVTDSAKGIFFVNSGNFYANNRASDNGTDFDLGATVQTDGGGNFSF